MKNKILYTLIAVVAIAFGCKKTDFSNESQGEALGALAISAPVNNTLLVLNSAIPNSKISFSWTAAKPGVSTAPTYKVVLALKTGNINTPLLELPSDNNGTSTTLNLTQKQLDDLLKGKGIADNVKSDLIWVVKATNGDVIVESSTLNISITRMGDGVSNFLLYGPVSSNTAVVINPNSTTDFMKFKWQKSFPGVATNLTKYQIKFVAKGGNFSTPLFTYTSDNTGLDSAASISYKDISDKMTAAGFTDQATPVALQWTVEATSGTFKKTSDYVNDLVITREVKIFLVGGDTPASWTAENALPMIADKNNPGTFYIYVNLNAGNGGFKFLNQQQWPGGSLNSADWGMKKGSPGDAAIDNEDNIENYGANGVYRVSFDQKNLKYYVQAGRMGAVGDATAAGWTPGSVFPSQGLTLVGTNKFMGFVNLTAGNSWKFIDGNAWGDGTPAGSKDFGQVKTKTDGSITQGDADNMTVPGTTGSYRITWDGTDIKNLKYSITTGTLYLIGAATVAGWNENAANLPAMTYQGNGKWAVTTNLTAGEFKFLIQKGTWNYSYGMGATAGALVDGGSNLSVAVAGNYTIVVDEFNKIYAVTKN